MTWLAQPTCKRLATVAIAAITAASLLLACGAADAATVATVDLPDTCSETLQNRPIRAITNDGLHVTRAFVVDRARFHRVGQRFSCRRYRREQTRMQGLDIFSTIRVTGVITADGGVRLTYRFVELPKYLAYPAVRRSDLYGWMAGPAVSFLNFLGRDIRLEAFLRTAVAPKPFVATELLLEASSPWIGQDVPIEYELSVLRNQSFNAVKQYNDTSWNAALSLYQRMTWRFRLIYAMEFTQVSPDPANPTFAPEAVAPAIPILIDPTGDALLGLNLGLLWDGRHRRVNPHSGVWMEARVGQYGGLLPGAPDYRLLLLDHRSWWNHRWSRDQLSILHLSALARMRPGVMGVYDYYVAGGPNSLRSFTQRAELHAQSEVLGTVELRHEFFDRRPFSVFGFHIYAGLQLVVGADLALLWRANDPLTGPPRSYGAIYGGPHILLPGVDRLRIEFGWHRDAAGRWRSGFAVGLFEKSTTQRLRQR